MQNLTNTMATSNHPWRNQLNHVKISQHHLRINKCRRKNNENHLKIRQNNSQIHEHSGKMNEDRVKFSQKHQKNEQHGKINEHFKSNRAQRA